MAINTVKESIKKIIRKTEIERKDWFSNLRMLAESMHPDIIHPTKVARYKTLFPIWKHCEIETYSFCNRDCSFCPRYNDRSGIRKDKNGKKIKVFMPEEKVYDLIDQVISSGFKGTFRFGRLSEALCDHRYLNFVTYLKRKNQKGIMLNEVSNGDILKRNEELVKELDGLIDQLVIGLYDYNDEIQKKEQIEFWKKTFKKTKIGFSLPLEKCIIRQGSNFYKHSIKRPTMIEYPCFATNKLLIRYDGNVSLCCEDDSCSFEMGNVFEKSIDEIWWYKKHIDIVRSLRKFGGRKKFKLCKFCYTSDKTIEIYNGAKSKN